MTLIINKYFSASFLIFLVCLLLPGSSPKGADQFGGDSARKSDPFYNAGCTVVYGADEDQAFGGNNEDSSDPNTMVYFLPPEDGEFGRALFGYENFVWQGGMNDQGLFFDALVGEELVHVPQGDKIPYQGSLPAKALASCADVPCVIGLFEKYHAYDDWIFQFFFGDASGNSVIIEPNMVLEGGAPFQVATNFYQSRTDIYTCRFCTRYWTARNLFEKADSLSVELIRDIMDAVHLEDESPTQYTTVYDLNQRLIYLYHFHNYGGVVTFNLDDELRKGYQAYSLVDLFPENSEFQEYAQPEYDRVAESRAKYTAVDIDPAVFEPYLGDYEPPDRLNPLFSYYSIAEFDGNLVLKMLPDKAWLELEPSSETTFFHVSGMSEIEITFLPDENGLVNEFNYRYMGNDYLFKRVNRDVEDFPADDLEGSNAELDQRSRLDSLLSRIGGFFGSNTVKFLGIILGLIILQALLGYVRSLLI